MLVYGRSETLVQNAALGSREIEGIALQQRTAGERRVAPSVVRYGETHAETVAGLVVKRVVDIDRMVDAHRHARRDSVLAAYRNVRNVIDGLVDHPALGLRWRDAISEIVESDDRAGIGDLRGLAVEERDLARKAAGPIERRTRRENHKARMRDQHASARPIMFIGKAPLDAAKDSLPNAPAPRGEEFGEAVSHGIGVPGGLEARVERNALNLDGA